MIVKGWKGSCDGVRLYLADRDRYCQPGWRVVEVEVGAEGGTIPLWPSFWRDCPELRGGIVQDLLRRERLTSLPPQFELTPLGGRRFRLTCL